MNWKAIQLLVAVIALLVILAFIRAHSAFDVRSILPFLGGQEVSIHDWAGVPLLLLFVWGISRLRRLKRNPEGRHTTGSSAQESEFPPPPAAPHRTIGSMHPERERPRHNGVERP